MLTDFQNSLAKNLTSKLAVRSSLTVPPHLDHVATLPCVKYLYSKIRLAQEMSEVNCHGRPQSLKTT